MENELLPGEVVQTMATLKKLRKLNSPQDRKTQIIIELIIIFFGAAITFMVAAHLDILETLVEISREHENWELDEILITCVFLMIALAAFAVRRWFAFRKTLYELKYLRGILPVCAGCGKVKDSAGNWGELERYISEHTEAILSHGLCDDCVRKYYGEEYLNEGVAQPTTSCSASRPD